MDLTLNADTLKTAFDNLDNKEKTALQVAADRVRTYHEKQKQTTWTYRERVISTVCVENQIELN
jgi:histidinol dehydrogenase